MGTETMAEVGRGRVFTLPFLWLGSWRNIMFPEQGPDIPFGIQNWAYRDVHGRETVTWLRTFEIGRRRCFDAYMIDSEERQRVVDCLGTHQHLAVDLEISFDTNRNGGIRIKSGAQRFCERFLGFRFPGFFTGVADVCEWFDDDLVRFRIEVSVENPVWGKLFGYRGAFDVRWVDTATEPVPEAVHPVRVERRE